MLHSPRQQALRQKKNSCCKNDLKTWICIYSPRNVLNGLKEVEEAYWFGAHPSVGLSVRPSVTFVGFITIEPLAIGS